MRNRNEGAASLMRYEEPLSSAENTLFEQYRERYEKSLPDRTLGFKYKPGHGEYVKSKESVFKDQHERGILLDRIVFHHGSSWFGGSVEIYRASRYDDIANQVDLIFEFLDEDNNRVGVLGVDTTVSGEDTLDTKQEKIMGKVRAGSLGKIEYGPTADGEIGAKYETLTDIPQVNLALSPEGLKRLSQQIVDAKSRKEIYANDVRFLFIEEVTLQLEAETRFILGNIKDEGRKELLASKIQILIAHLSEIYEREMASRNSARPLPTDRIASYLGATSVWGEEV
jgi:hypothetical protein